MSRFFPLFILVLTLGCNNQASNEQLISSLEQKVDSIQYLSINPTKKEPLVDSLLKLKPDSYIGLTWKAVICFNENRIDNAIKNLNKSLEVKEHELSSHYTLHGMCLERLGLLDSAKQYYIKALEIPPTTIFDTLEMVKLETVINGSEQGLTKLGALQNIVIELVYRTIENDVENYQGNGLSEFEPIYERDNYIAEFELFTDDSTLVGQGYNRRDMLELLYARKGINISVQFSGTSTNRMTFLVTDKYLSKVEQSNLFEIKRL